jgi:hypothetical protein
MTCGSSCCPGLCRALAYSEIGFSPVCICFCIHVCEARRTPARPLNIEETHDLNAFKSLAWGGSGKGRAHQGPVRLADESILQSEITHVPIPYLVSSYPPIPLNRQVRIRLSVFGHHANELHILVEVTNFPSGRPTLTASQRPFFCLCTSSRHTFLPSLFSRDLPTIRNKYMSTSQTNSLSQVFDSQVGLATSRRGPR